MISANMGVDKLVVVSIMAAALSAGAVGLYLTGRNHGAAKVETKYQIEKQMWAEKVEQQQSDYDAATSQMVVEFLQEQARYQSQIELLKKKPKIVDRFVPVNTVCTIPKGFVELHNIAAAGKSVADADDTDAGAPTDKSLRDVASTVAYNYYTCNDIRQQLSTLQSIVTEFQQAQKELIE
jgi:hypothetical protein